MQRTKFLGLLLILTTIFSATASAQKAKIKTWTITVAQSGGYAGFSNSYTLDNKGNLTRKNKSLENYEKIDDVKTKEIGKLIRDLKLPGTKLKTVKGLRIYDAVYNSFVININGKVYSIEGASFFDAKYVALSAGQKATLEKLKTILKELKGYKSDSQPDK